MPALVQLERVSMVYGRGAAAVRVVDEVTLGIAAGEFIAVLQQLIVGRH